MKYLALLFLISCNVYDLPVASKMVGPRFHVGDCVYRTFKDNIHEFEEPEVDINKIVKVGKRNYLYQFKFGSILMQSEFSISHFDRVYERVNCPKDF